MNDNSLSIILEAAGEIELASKKITYILTKMAKQDIVNSVLGSVKPDWKQGKAYCGACGKRIPTKIKAHYCHKCGVKLDWQGYNHLRK